MEIASQEQELRCAACGYDLRGLATSRRCPECGESFDPDAKPTAAIPWLHRRELGNFIAFWQTVAMVTMSPWRLGNQVGRPVAIDEREVRYFRRLCILIATVSVVLTCELGLSDLGNPIVTILIAAPAAWVFFLITTIAQEALPLPPSSPVAVPLGTLQPFCCANLALTPLVPAIGVLWARGLIGENQTAYLCLAAAIGIAVLGWLDGVLYVSFGAPTHRREGMSFFFLGLPCIWYVAGIASAIVAVTMNLLIGVAYSRI